MTFISRYDHLVTPTTIEFAVLQARAAVISVALDERDRPTHQHCDRVVGLAMELGHICGLSARELRVLSIAAGFHDIGKIGIPDAVLKKREKFDDRDWEVMKAHSAKGERIMLAAGFDDGDRIGTIIETSRFKIE